MKKKQSKKTKYIIILFVITILLSIICVQSTTYAFDPNAWEPSQMGADDADQIKVLGNTVIGFLQLIGSLLSVAVLIIIGIRYMMGSVEERAQYKKTLGPYIVGAIMVFAISNILALIVEIAKIF